MNSLLQLKGEFGQKKRVGSVGASNLPKSKSITSAHLKKLLNELEHLHNEWQQSEKYFDGVLIQVLYRDVIAKSRRLSEIFSGNASIVGAKFSKNDKPRHIITHYVGENLLRSAIKKYKNAVITIDSNYFGSLNYEQIKSINATKPNLQHGISRSSFVQLIVDSYFIESFFLERLEDDFAQDAIITIYDTGTDVLELMNKIGIKIPHVRLIDKTTLYLTPDQIKLLKLKAPYLIAMGTNDISTLSRDDFESSYDNTLVTIPSPTSEPTIGVIDTLFDESVYFSEWVEFVNMVDTDIPTSQDDYKHGTSVSSIIVDGATINPHLDDGCGRFKVRHFGVAAGDTFSSFTILRSIKEIILKNPDIKVWNISLGSIKEVHPHYISPEADFLDRIQHENNVIFVIAGTNKIQGYDEERYIGSPADSINSVVVNAVNELNLPASYARKGPVLSFFTKPDIAYFGGDIRSRMTVCTPTGKGTPIGTSYAAPWIARKLSYMIDILGLSREIAKALLLHSAVDWKEKEVNADYVGHGVVPQHIDDIVKSKDDEIRFVISGISEEHLTYTYNLPVPALGKKHPFIAKATMCYFPSCSRAQGVDYTNTEFEFAFGRISDDGKLKGIDKLKADAKTPFLYEGNARKLYRKWDNVKQLLEVYTGKNQPRMAYSSKLWGITIRTLERLDTKHGKGLNFGVVITLKELSGKNRIEDFIRLCQLRGWLVNRIDVAQRIHIHNLAEEEVTFDDD